MGFPKGTRREITSCVDNILGRQNSPVTIAGVCLYEALTPQFYLFQCHQKGTFLFVKNN